jgi:hypothetical protein
MHKDQEDAAVLAGASQTWAGWGEPTYVTRASQARSFAAFSSRPIFK